MIAENSKLC
jgi:NTE family protein